MKKNIDVLNAQEAADFLGAHLETIRRLARKGEIPSYKIGKDWRFLKEALTNWAETHHLRRKPPLVLVIDDDAGVRKLMRRYLEADGYRVCLASDGTEGLTWLNRESVNLILLDLKMPGMNGPEFLKEMRKMNHELPVIVATGYPDGDLMAEALRHGPLTLVAKPIDREQLMQAVRKAINGSHGIGAG
ncbi:MAG: response regulator [Syntrophaceae bacterium]|nr:response regulator [Syntrophaceae bacterium]